MISSLNLDKKILTRNALFRAIRTSNMFKTKRSKDTAIKVIQYLNGERKKTPISERRISNYMHMIYEGPKNIR